MNKVIRLNESDLFDIVNKVLNGYEKQNTKPTFINKLDNLLEFHIKLHKGLYNVYGNYSELEKKKNDYLNNLFPHNHKVIKEARHFFPKKLLTESHDENYVDEFFGFIREKFIKQHNNRDLTEQANAQQQKMAQARASAIPLAKSLMKAFDGAGTDEQLAVQTIKKIKSKEEIYQLDKILKSYKRGSLKDYINGDMSDFDSAEYRAIWTHLGKFGVTGANYNNFLAGVGKVVDAIGQGWSWLKKNGLDWFMNEIRDFLDSGWGQSAQLFLDSFGIGAAINVVVWGVMAIWDLLNNNWGLLLLSSLSILTAGAIAPIIGKFAKNFKGITGGFAKAMEVFKNSAIFKGIKAWLPKISQGIISVGKYVSQGAEWLISKFGKYLPANWVSAIKSGVKKATDWVKSIGEKIMAYAGEGSGENVITQNIMKQGTKHEWPGLQKIMANPQWANTLKGLDAATSKVIDDYVTAWVRKYSWDKIEGSICSNMSAIACKAVKTIGISYEMKRAGKETLHYGKESKGYLTNASKQVQNTDKAKDLYRASSNLKTTYQKGLETTEKGEELAGGEGEA